MTKRSFLLLFAAIAILSGGLFTLRGTWSKARTPRRKLPTGIRITNDVPASPKDESGRTVYSSHIIAVLVAAVIFGAGAYLGLGSSESVDARLDAEITASPTPTVTVAPAPAPYEPSLLDDIHATVPRANPADLKFAVEAAIDAPTAVDAVEAPEDAAEPAAAPEPEPEPAAAPRVLPTDGFEAIICAKAWPCSEAIAVASCESGLDMSGRLDGNWATNGNNYGLFQINSVHAYLWPDFYTDWMDPVKNTDWAYELWLTSGWRPWQCQPY